VIDDLQSRPAALSIEDVPSVEGCTLGRGHTLSWNRRQLLQRIFGGAVAVSLLSLSVLPPARRAYASHAGSPGYQIKGLPCPSYAANHNCTPGCGDSTVCGHVTGGHCCINQVTRHRYGWHKHNSAYPRYKLRPNECVSGTGWDGWVWKTDEPCGVCFYGVRYRCHDGWWRNRSGTWVKRICRTSLYCDTRGDD
jgi:hypothetical protein